MSTKKLILKAEKYSRKPEYQLNICENTKQKRLLKHKKITIIQQKAQCIRRKITEIGDIMTKINKLRS